MIICARFNENGFLVADGLPVQNQCENFILIDSSSFNQISDSGIFPAITKMEGQALVLSALTFWAACWGIVQIRRALR